ncbi:ABC transporter ATP-binding protein [Phytomonospora sp. NPDC050363]|uniref:ABC transporter ATP-binding protein n=1 Tax=Phytomonospora sp. NPDC050363 TaxID=3155642 RepID=UPI0033C37A1B
MPSGPLVKATALHKTYRTGADEPIRACDDVSVEVERGEIVAVTGPSGSGKSTLLHLIGALDSPDDGTIVVDGTEITALKRRRLPEYRRRIGFVFQRFHLLPTLTAADNVAAPLLPYKTAFDKHAKAAELLDAVGLKGRETALPAKLSGGQQQRVAIARALVNDPVLLLADEPTGNLDSRTGEEIVDMLFELRERLGTTMMIATHDAGLAERCDRVVRVRDGKVTDA